MVQNAAKGYVTQLIRVPEAYLLLRRFDTTRPGLLILDADGRRVDSIDLRPALRGELEPEAVAKRLSAAKTKTPTERFWLKTDDPTASLEVAGAQSVRKIGNYGLVIAEPGRVRPEELVKKAKGWTLIDPVPVTVKEKRVFVSRTLLSPDRFGDDSDVEFRVFDLPQVPKGPSGARVAAAPLNLPGVLGVTPNFALDEELVVGRKGEVDWELVLEAFRAAGVKEPAIQED